MNNYELKSIIGQGTYGVVYNATYLPTDQNFAIKKLYKKYKTQEEYSNLNEIKFLNQYSHQNIITLKEIIHEKEEVYLVFEMMQQNLFQFYYKQKKKKKQISEYLIAKIIQQILKGIAFIHSVGYFHRDLKPENILISRDTIKICDFGQIKDINSIPPFTEYTSTRWYRSPEQLVSEGQYSYPADIFAIGVIMAELYTMKPLFQGKSQIDQLNQICNILGTPQNIQKTNFPICQPVSLDNIITNACPEAIDLMNKIFQFDPSLRPSALQLLQHEYFRKFQKYEENNRSKSIFKINVIQKTNTSPIDDFTDEQIKILSMSLEPKHKQLTMYRNNIDKIDIFQKKQIKPSQNKCNSKLFNLKQNIINKEQPKVVFPKIMNNKKKF